MNDKVRILFVVPSMRGGGSERFISTLISNIDTSRYDVALVLLKKVGPFLTDLPRDLTVYDLDVEKARYCVHKIIKIIRKYQPDSVFSTLSYLNLIIGLIRPFISKDIRFIARETNTVSVRNKYQPYPRLFDFLYRVVYKNFDNIIAQAEFMKEDLIKNYQIDERKISVINNPVDVAHITLQSLSDVFLYSKNNINLLAVGSFTEQKGFDTLLKALSRLEDKYFLTVLGEGGLENHYKRLAHELGVTARVHFAGFKRNPYPYMKQADLFILSSRYEGFPNVVLEANACGTPVVAFDCPGGTGEIMQDGLNGFLAKCQDVDHLIEKILEASNLGFNSQEITNYIISKYGLQKIINQYQNVLC